MLTARRSDERGVALILTLFLALVVAGMAVGVILMASNSNLIAKFHSSEAMMAAAADAGLEQGRDTLNGTPGIVPVGLGFVTLETNAPVRDANGVIIPGFTRSLYAGENGDTTGQFGSFASVISVISNVRGAVVVRRIQLKQDSFSRFARFFNTWACCMWGATEVVFGPVHSNQGMAVQNGAPGATFWGPVTTVNNITNQGAGNWNGGVTTGAPSIPFPTTQTLNNLQAFAVTSGTNMLGYATVAATDPDTRIEFYPLDMNNDGDFNDADEGFVRVYRVSVGGVQQDKRNYVTARNWNNPPPGGWNVNIGGALSNTSAASDPNFMSPNCGGVIRIGGVNTWMRADSIWAYGGIPAVNWNANRRRDSIRVALRGAGRRCFSGGDPRLFQNPTTPANQAGQHRIADAYGSWQVWPGWGANAPASVVNAVNAAVANNRFALGAGVTAQALANTFWPITRAMNPNFKGVMFVTGSVALSGTLRGRVTVVATGNVVLNDDINYIQPPGTTCADILGVLTQRDAVIQDNSINTPFMVSTLANVSTWTVQFDDTPNEVFQGFFLTLGLFQGEAFAGDPAVTAPENCGGKSRGCKSIIGGTIQQGIAATFTGNSGWAEQDTYDGCGVTNPPPYYPTTGRFTKNRYYEIDPVGFNVAAWFAANQ
jgi:hypothetical protein